ncbi:MAG: 30S ribosomal protein S4 [Candidatus Paceibacterota bacterium]|jgi:small subunit ribosomal protein S4
MARETSPRCKKCRREGKKLLLKGERCYSVKCAMIKRAYAPGQHGQSKKRMSSSEYGTQLREKQRVKRSYGILERQFRKYFELASRTKGNTVSFLSTMLEQRLDNVVYRLGFGTSRSQARQLVNHNHFKVNGKKVNIPSYQVKEGDVISIKSEKSKYFQDLRNSIRNYQAPSWLALDYKKMEGKVLSLPTEKETFGEFDFNQVVEFYSK